MIIQQELFSLFASKMLEEVKWQRAFSESMPIRLPNYKCWYSSYFSNQSNCSRGYEKEVGIDISKQNPKDLTEDMMRNATAIINMGCMDDKSCPALFVSKVID